jgi:hypothetical protein
MHRRYRRRRPRRRIQPLTAKQILAWADNHFARTGGWPHCTDRHVLDNLNEKWVNIDAALRAGHRGLPGGSSLPQLLAERRGVRNIGGLSGLSEDRIAVWAQAYHRRIGRWPHCTDTDGPPGETWQNLDAALRMGLRALPGGSSLPQLLAERFWVRNLHDLPRLTEEQILTWADAHHKRTGKWPQELDGPVIDAPAETWGAVNHALYDGLRGMSGGSSLARLLQARRGVRNVQDLPDLSEKQILAWAQSHFERTGQWPQVKCGPVLDAPRETWLAVDSALREGLRGLRGGSSLWQLLTEQKGARNKARAPRLTLKQILAWADAHHRRTGGWPMNASGPIAQAPGETWGAVDSALRYGGRGLAGGSSLLLLLATRRGVRNAKRPPPLTPQQILAWASVHRKRTGKRPSQKSGPVAEAPGETWSGINGALKQGCRGLPGGDSLPRLLQRHAARHGRKG